MLTTAEQQMKISNLSIRNFRLLADVSLSLEDRTTVIVGSNNCGKTSLTELFRRLLGEKAPSFRCEDFSLKSHDDFWRAFELFLADSDDDTIRDALPAISVKIAVTYDPAMPSIGALSDFVIDLDPRCNDALVVLCYSLRDGSLHDLFDGIVIDPGLDAARKKSALMRALRERIPDLFVATCEAHDPNDPSNFRAVDWARFRSLVHGGFINAQRGLDDETHKHRNVLGSILESLFRTASSSSASAGDQTIATSLQTAVKDVQTSIGDGFNTQLLQLLPAFATFGYPGFADPKLMTETTLDVERLLSDHTTVHYVGVNGINLPESYNGLGTRNLIFILLKLLELYKSFMASERPPGVQLIFIEEPEVHLHPQMQEVFIERLNEIPAIFAKTFGNSLRWPVQFVVTTHSSHVANRARFDAIRYFSASATAANLDTRTTTVRDLKTGLGGTPAADLEFLHKYLTLTKCDLFFAQKAVLIEGTAERILLPRMIEKSDKKRGPQEQLSSQYLSVIEIGGAYAHLFFGLVRFLGIRTLVITDIDSTKGKEKCVVSEGDATSNACIRAWFSEPKCSPAALMAKPDAAKVAGSIRIAYQVPESGTLACGRTFEDAFVLANQGMFDVTGSSTTTLETVAAEQADSLGKKSDFALRYATENLEWVVPRYIEEGLDWLASQDGATDAIGPAAGAVPPQPA